MKIKPFEKVEQVTMNVTVDKTIADALDRCCQDNGNPTRGWMLNQILGKTLNGYLKTTRAKGRAAG